MSVEVHIEWQGTTLPVGRLYSAGRGKTVSFEYSAERLTGKPAFAIDPTSMPLQRGMLHSLSQGKGKLPPVVQLPALLRATEAIHSETETAKDRRFLLGQGSPLGGACPKSAVTQADGELGIAKFPKPDDVRDIAAGEILALSLARASGIRAADHQLVSISSRAVAVIRRFDRVNGSRIPFISAAACARVKEFLCSLVDFTKVPPPKCVLWSDLAQLPAAVLSS